MKITNDHLLLLVKEHGAEKALRYINIEDIEDHTVKVIARTIQYSGRMLEDVLVDHAFTQATGEVDTSDK